MQNDSRMGAAPLLALLIVGSGVAFAQEAAAQETDSEAFAAQPTNERARTNEDASGNAIIVSARRVAERQLSGVPRRSVSNLAGDFDQDWLEFVPKTSGSSVEAVIKRGHVALRVYQMACGQIWH